VNMDTQFLYLHLPCKSKRVECL